MSLDDFCALTPGELEAVAGAWSLEQQRQDRGAWERARTVAYIAIQPHITSRLTPRQLLPLPWDTEEHRPEATPELTPEQQQHRFEQLARTLG